MEMGIDYTLTGDKKYKYEIRRPVTIQTRVFRRLVDHKYFSLSPDGVLTAKRGYRWDGATFCPDFEHNFVEVLGHDIGYQILQEIFVKLCDASRSSIRRKLDKLLSPANFKGVLNKTSSYIIYRTVRAFGGWFSKRKKGMIKTMSTDNDAETTRLAGEVSELWKRIEDLQKPNYAMLKLCVSIIGLVAGWLLFVVASKADLKDAELQYLRETSNIRLEISQLRILILSNRKDSTADKPNQGH